MKNKLTISNRISYRTVLLLLISLCTACTPQDKQGVEGINSSESDNAYPDWTGQWQRGLGSLNWTSEGYEEAGTHPLTNEFMDRWRA